MSANEHDDDQPDSFEVIETQAFALGRQGNSQLEAVAQLEVGETVFSLTIALRIIHSTGYRDRLRTKRTGCLN